MGSPAADCGLLASPAFEESGNGIIEHVAASPCDVLRIGWTAAPDSCAMSTAWMVARQVWTPSLPHCKRKEDVTKD